VSEPRIFGYAVCANCGATVLDVVAWKTQGRCADCFRNGLGPVFDEIVAVAANRERIRLKLDRRTPGERAQRRRSKDRAKKRDDQRERNRVTMLARTRAQARLTRTFPDIFEFYLADERAKLGLEAWTIDRALTGHRLTDETMELLRAYAALDKKADRC
jgi:hypothetical protein